MKTLITLLLVGLLCASTTAHEVHASKKAPHKVWISLDETSFKLLQTIDPSVESYTRRALPNGVIVNGRASRELIFVAHVNAALLDDLSAQVHKVEHHCAGFVRHASLAEATSALQSRRSVVAFTRPSYEITHQSAVQPMLDQMMSSNIENTIVSLSDFQNRYYNGSYGAQASDWLANTWQTMAAGRSDIGVEQVYRGNDAQASVVLTIEGAEQADQVLVMGAHLDSINHSDPNGPQETARAPGADDDASGVASLTEVLRVLLANDYHPQRTIKLMAYAGEEAGLLGSGYLADDFANRGVDVAGVLQLDMTNYQGSAGDIYLVDDYTDAQQNGFLEDIAGTYLPALDVRHTQCGYACSDHASWAQQGYPASMPFEASMGGSNPYIHSSEDTFANSGGQASHALKFSRLALAYVVELADMAGGDDDGGGDDNGSTLDNGVPVPNLSANQGTQTVYTLDVPAAATDLSFTLTNGSGDVDLFVQFAAEPSTSTYDCRSVTSTANEECTIASPQAGTWYVMLDAYSTYSNVTLEGSYSADGGGDDGGGDSCPTGYTEYSDTLNSGDSAYQPNGNYYYVRVSAAHDGILSGPTGSDFDLYLQKWNGGGWGNVDKSTSSGADETISYNGTSGYYVWKVTAYSGSGVYTLCLDIPD